nr:hypothetical protein [Frankia canadensis]
MLVGDPFDARRAYEAGLVNVLAEPGRALEAALVPAERICRNAPSAVRACLAAADAAGWQATAGALDAIRDSADAAEGVRAFLEMRPPAWTGR